MTDTERQTLTETPICRIIICEFFFPFLQTGLLPFSSNMIKRILDPFVLPYCL